MGKVLSHMTMSLDGFIADPKDNPGELFEWYEAGDVTIPTPNKDVSFKVDEASAKTLKGLTEQQRRDCRRPAALRHCQGLGRSPSRGRAGGRRHASSAQGCRQEIPADDFCRWGRCGDRQGAGDCRRQGRRSSRAPTSSSRRSTSASWTRSASASRRCCSARASRTSRSWRTGISCWRTRRSPRVTARFT